MGKTIDEVFPNGAFNFIKTAIAQVVRTGQAVLFARHAIPVNGETRIHDVKLVPERDASGQLVSVLGIGRDMTDLYRAQDDRAARERALRALAKFSPGMMGPRDIDPMMTAGITLEEGGNTPVGQKASLETRCRRRDGCEWPVGLSATDFMAGQEKCALLVAHDITERKRHEQSLRDSRDFLLQIMDGTADPIFVKDRSRRWVLVNEAFCNFVGHPRDALIGKSANDFFSVEQSESLEDRDELAFTTGKTNVSQETMTDAHGAVRDYQIKKTPFVSADGQKLLIGVIRDITELNEQRLRMHQMAFYDALTGLPNRALFNDRLRQMVAESTWHTQQAGVMLLDLDRFKTINDTLGHPAGDTLLMEAAQRITRCVRTYDTVARLGGDEFAILLPDIRAAEDLGRIASKILGAFIEPFVLEGKEVFSSTSVGISVFPDDHSKVDELVRLADVAMYFAKRCGRNNFRFYSKELTAASSEKLALESELRRALERQELELYYQPKIALTDSRLIGSEALLRWNNPKRGLVSPDQFIGIAEDSGLIVDMGAWVLREACRTACGWNRPGNPRHQVAINLSARQFQSSDILQTVCLALEQTGCQPEWIELEITESLLLDEDGDVLATLNALRELGISIAIDDFGTGYSALSYLARFPISTLKIDRSFISAIMVDRYRAELVKAILSIAHCLGQQVVAEGVETPEQATFLEAHGCQTAQGYLYSKPISRVAFEQFALSFLMAAY
jgi:diguanylate cyclase (GGDEF)-like protein/PAS domain S-box-containing protein